MKTQWQKFETSAALLASLSKKVAEKGDIFSFRSDPLLASLVSCLGLEFELGKSDQDRTSFLLGIDLKKEMWETEIITYGGNFGLLAWVPGRKELSPLHEDFCQILHPLSIEEGILKQLVIFPNLVAENYAKRGIELVVVKDWVMAAFLGNTKLNYQRTNLYEIEQNISLTQMSLIESRQLAFTGTHDLGDHLLGADEKGFAACDSIIKDLRKTFAQVFNGTKQNRAFVLSYLIAVMLDDLVQPQWYASPEHLTVIRRCLELINEKQQVDLPTIFLPQSFHNIVAGVRDRSLKKESNHALFLQFTRDLMIPEYSNPYAAAMV